MGLSKLISCRHCGNTSKMEIIGEAKEKDPEWEEDYINEHGVYYSILKCPACKKINMVSYF